MAEKNSKRRTKEDSEREDGRARFYDKKTTELESCTISINMLHSSQRSACKDPGFVAVHAGNRSEFARCWEQ